MTEVAPSTDNYGDRLRSMLRMNSSSSLTSQAQQRQKFWSGNLFKAKKNLMSLGDDDDEEIFPMDYSETTASETAEPTIPSPRKKASKKVRENGSSHSRRSIVDDSSSSSVSSSVRQQRRLQSSADGDKKQRSGSPLKPSRRNGRRQMHRRRSLREEQKQSLGDVSETCSTTRYDSTVHDGVTEDDVKMVFGSSYNLISSSRGAKTSHDASQHDVSGSSLSTSFVEPIQKACRRQLFGRRQDASGAISTMYHSMSSFPPRTSSDQNCFVNVHDPGTIWVQDIERRKRPHLQLNLQATVLNASNHESFSDRSFQEIWRSQRTLNSNESEDTDLSESLLSVIAAAPREKRSTKDPSTNEPSTNDPTTNELSTKEPSTRRRQPVDPSKSRRRRSSKLKKSASERTFKGLEVAKASEPQPLE